MGLAYSRVLGGDCTKRSRANLSSGVGEPKDTPFRQQQLGGFKKDKLFKKDYVGFHEDSESKEDDEGSESKVWVDHECICISCDGRNSFLLINFLVCLFSICFCFNIARSESASSLSERYDNVCEVGSDCTLFIDVEQNLKAPIRFNYKLVNFHQNHRVYLGSKSHDQLRGSFKDTDGCQQLSTLSGLSVYPCGLHSQSIFTDRFNVIVQRDSNNQSLCQSCPEKIDEIVWSNYWNAFEYEGTWERIGSWDELASDKFKTPSNIPSDITRNSLFLKGTRLMLPLPNDTDFQVWMYTAAKDTFMKPHREIRNFDILAGDRLYVNVFPFFDPGPKGQKHIVFEAGSEFTTVFIGNACLSISVWSFIIFSYAMMCGRQ